ncbi:MAG: efflux RND transporter periplasmic adaptor subunit [Vicinamibacterales bacterium]
MKRNRSISTLLLGSLAVSAAPAMAGQKPTITDEHVQELIRTAAERVGAQTGAPSATSAQAADATRPTLDLSLEDAVKLALDRNLDIAVQRLNPSTYDFTYSNLAAVYRPSLTSLISRQSVTNPSTSTISGGSQAGAGVETGTNTYNGGIAQNIKWGGGSFALTLNNNKQSTTSTNSLFNPSFNTNWSAQYTQPLLRNFKIDSTRQQLVVTRLNQDISEIQLQASIINTVSNVRNAYWDLVFAIQSVDVARTSVELAERLVQDNQTRVEIGTMAPIDVVQAQSQAATQRQNLAVAEGTRRTNELVLKRLIVAGTQDPNWNAAINPTERPDFAPQPIDVAAAVKRGLENRTDLAQAQKNLAVNDVTLKYLTNQTLPQADLIARYGLVGVGGEQVHGVHGERRQPQLHGHDCRQLHRLVVVAAAFELSDLELPAERHLPNRVQRAGSDGRARAHPGEPGAGAAQTDRAADRDRHHQRGDQRAEQRRARAGGTGGARVRAADARSRTEQVRSRHVDQLLRRPGTARSRHRAEQRVAGGTGLSQVARRARATAADIVEHVQHHDSRPVDRPPRKHTEFMKRGVIVVLVLAAAAGGYYYYSKQKAAATTATASAGGAGGAQGRGRGGAGASGNFGGGGGFGFPGGGPRLPMTVELAAVKRSDMRESLSVVGNLIGAATVEAVPKAAGRLETVNVKLGDPVVKGQRLAKLDDREIVEQVKQAKASFDVSAATIRQREADLKLAQTNLDRSRNLYERQLIPRQTFDDTDAKYQAALAALDLARAQYAQAQARLDELSINLTNTVITSPVSGFVGRRSLDAGGWVTPNTTTFISVVDITTVRLVANVVEKDLRRINSGMKASVAVDAYPGETFTGRIAQVAPVLDPATRTAQIEVEIPNPNFRLKPGMYAKVDFVVEHKENTLVVPANAIVDLDGKKGVFLPDEGDVARFKPVTIGMSQPDVVEVVDGLAEGTRVVTTGAAALREGDRIVLLGAGANGRRAWRTRW